MTAPTRCSGGTHVTPPQASSCTCGDITRVTATAPPADSALREALWEAIANVRDASPRLPNDADTYDIADAALAVFAAHLGQQQEAFEDLLKHIARMADDWAEMGPGEQRNRDLWAPLHRKADAVRAALGADL